MTTQITQLPPAPSRADPANFASLADSFVAALPTFGSQANQLAVEVNQNALSAQAAGNAVAWVSGSNPAQGTVVYDTTDFRSYRRTNQSILPGTTTRPGLTTQGWVRLTGQGDVLVGSSNTFTATNTFNAAVTFNQPITVPAGATGSQAPRSSEVIRLSGGAAQLPTWTTSTRPSGYSGATGFNTQLGIVEAWNGSAWTAGGFGTSSPVSTSGASSFQITGIPSTAKTITLVLDGVSLNTDTTTNWFIRIGSGTIETTGYDSVLTNSIDNSFTSAAGFLARSVENINSARGQYVLQKNPSSNTYIVTGTVTYRKTGSTTVGGANFFVSTGAVTLSGVLDRIAIQTGSSVQFDAGNIWVTWS
jgi:hypothetical protein